MRKIIFNWMPPALVYFPSPALSVLKKYLTTNGYEVEIIYWNLLLSDLQKEFVWTDEFKDQDILSMHLLFNYLAIKNNDKKAYDLIKINLRTIKPQYRNSDRSFFDNHMLKYAKYLDERINSIINKFELDKALYWGFNINLYQWIGASIVAEKLKSINKNIPTVIGGLGSDKSAEAYLKNFNQFDIALWGEGENSLLDMTDIIAQNESRDKFSNISQISYKKEGEIITIDDKRKEYVNLSSTDIRPDFYDYFQTKKDLNLDIITHLPVEGGRGCHWNRCHFCYLNKGYKFRQKSNEIILDEIIENINKYNITEFNFLDNDIIGGDFERFDDLLDRLIKLKDTYPEFSILLAEIITKGIHSSFIKKMHLAGFKYVQIGYESPSNTLLSKIAKKNSFASNLLFIKFADYYEVHVGGANIIRGLLEETDQDVIEAIENLHSLRFFLEPNKFYHTISHLGIFHTSKYFKQIQSDIKKWKNNNIISLLPDRYIKDENDFFSIIEGFSESHNKYWDAFQSIESHYLKNNYYYKSIRNNTLINYKEYYNDSVVNEIEFQEDSLEWLLLETVNDEVKSFDEIICVLKKHNKYTSDDIIVNILENLKQENLIYTTDNYNEIVSIINTNYIL